MKISFKASIRTGFFKRESFLVSFYNDEEEMVLEHENNTRRILVPFREIKSIHLSADRSELNIRTDKTMIDGIVQGMENAYEITEMFRSTFGPIFMDD